jgi:hypothetical protein
MASATYEVQYNEPYKLSGVAKVRLRCGSIWFWDNDDRILLVVPAGYATLVKRVDLDAGTADDDVMEIVNNYGPMPDRPVLHRISGVASLKVIQSDSDNYNFTFLELCGDDKKLPQALVREGAFTIRRDGAVFRID